MVVDKENLCEKCIIFKRVFETISTKSTSNSFYRINPPSKCLHLTQVNFFSHTHKRFDRFVVWFFMILRPLAEHNANEPIKCSILLLFSWRSFSHSFDKFGFLFHLNFSVVISIRLHSIRKYLTIRTLKWTVDDHAIKR